MSDLIRREDVLEMMRRTKVAAMSGEAGFNKSQQNAIRAIADLFSAVVKDIPAVDAVKHESWIEDGYHDIECVCSYCGGLL